MVFDSSRVKVNVQLKLSLCLTKHHAMKIYGQSGGIAPRILNLGTAWRWMLSFMPRQEEEPPGTHWIWDWVGPRASLESVAKRKIPSLPLPGNEPRSSGLSLVFTLTELPICKRGFFPGGGGVKVITHLHPLPRLRMRGAYRYSPLEFSCCNSKAQGQRWMFHVLYLRWSGIAQSVKWLATKRTIGGRNSFIRHSNPIGCTSQPTELKRSQRESNISIPTRVEVNVWRSHLIHLHVVLN
jgi:hypothetical protein